MSRDFIENTEDKSHAEQLTKEHDTPNLRAIFRENRKSQDTR